MGKKHLKLIQKISRLPEHCIASSTFFSVYLKFTYFHIYVRLNSIFLGKLYGFCQVSFLLVYLWDQTMQILLQSLHFLWDMPH